MIIRRRTFLGSGLAFASLASTALLPTRAVSEMSLGEARLRTVSDGNLILPESFVIGDLPEDEAVPIVKAAGYAPDNLEAPCNLALWEDGDARVLFDAGSGSGFMPSAGEIVGNLEALGLAPDDITHVIFTHGHPDHLWGALDDFDEPLFLNAQHYMGAEEHAYWSDPATLDTIGAARQSFAAGAARRLEVLGDGLTLAGAGDEILPGLSMVSLPGHTPGHMGARIVSGGESVLIVGDAIGNAHLALARPEWPSPADQDPDQGIATRISLLEDLAESGETMVGFHLPDGGIGRIEAAEAGYSFRAL
jgi:glyoxylase-like metal-dependent hydrolase (beta-lactamase superfamily II)